jgi:NTE family protein
VTDLSASQALVDVNAKKTALILSGGGARAAYQVGVVKAIADMLPKGSPNPFPIICGTSAGAINAIALATHAARFRLGVLGLEAVWRGFRAEHVYRTDFPGLSSRGFKWLNALFLGGIGANRPISLLDNTPLAQLIEKTVRFDRINQAIEAGHLHAVSVTCSGYTGGESVSFFEACHGVSNWRRARRLGVRTRLRLDHLLASSAIPVVFPAVHIDGEYYGDGSVRQLAPISPALHLGAERVLVIGVSGNEDHRDGRPLNGYPSVAQIAGHLLDSAFIDSLEGDVERLERINRTVSIIPENIRERENLSLRQVEVLKIYPSQVLDQIAARHVKELPRSMRFFLRGSGANKGSGSTIASYLLFEEGFCGELIDLGYQDTMAQQHRIMHFLGYDPVKLYGDAMKVQSDIC